MDFLLQLKDKVNSEEFFTKYMETIEAIPDNDKKAKHYLTLLAFVSPKVASVDASMGKGRDITINIENLDTEGK